jgi:hypothetical protein
LLSPRPLLGPTSSTDDACRDCTSGGVPDDDGGGEVSEDDAFAPRESVVDGVLKPDEEVEEGDELRLSRPDTG